MQVAVWYKWDDSFKAWVAGSNPAALTKSFELALPVGTGSHSYRNEYDPLQGLAI